MRGRRFLIAALAVCLVLGWTMAFAAPQYVQRDKVDIKKGMGSFYPTVYTAKKGEALEVISDKEGWLQVSTPKGPGFVFAKALAPSKPTGGLSNLVGAHNTSDLDKTAGFKGFDAPTEEAFVRTNNLQAQMAMVDALERVPFVIQELQSFQQMGKVGAMGGAR